MTQRHSERCACRRLFRALLHLSLVTHTCSFPDVQGPSVKNVKLLFKLLDYTVETFYPDIWRSTTDPEVRYLSFYQEVVRRTARCVIGPDRHRLRLVFPLRLIISVVVVVLRL